MGCKCKDKAKARYDALKARIAKYVKQIKDSK